MNISAPEFNLSRATAVQISSDTLTVELTDGRSLSVPLAWYPRLAHATAAERSNWRLIGGGEGIAWPEVEEDLSVGSLIAGHTSKESQSSLNRWLASRKA